MTAPAVVGRWVSAPGAAEIVTGDARYCPDIRLPGLLTGKLLYAPHPRARIARLDVGKARAIPGVHAVLTHADIPGENSYLYAEPDQPLLAEDEVRFQGDAVAAVAAEDERTAAAALAAIEVEYEPLPGVFDPLEAMREDAPRIVAGEDNVIMREVYRTGDVEAAFAAADVVVENTYRTRWAEHAFLETEGAVAQLDDEGVLTVYSSCQAPHRDRMQIARALGLPESRVRVVTPYIGGAFGGKDEAHVQMHAALLAHAARRPVRLIRDRRESILTHVKRHPITVECATAASRDGRILAVRARAIADAGPYTNATYEVVNKFGEFIGGPYRVENLEVEKIGVRTNNPISGAFRGFGAPQAAFVYESQMDDVARELGMDPLELRLLNGVETGTRMYTGVVVRAGDAMKASLRRAAELIGWQGRTAQERQPAPQLRRGWGMATILKGSGLGRGLGDHAGVVLEMHRDASVVLRSGAADMGQGIVTVMAQLAAERLGVEYDAVRVVRADTAQAPDAGASCASRQAMVSGNAVLAAADSIRATLLGLAARKLRRDQAELDLRAGEVWADGEPSGLTVRELAERASAWGYPLHAEHVSHFEYPPDVPEASYRFSQEVFQFCTQVAQVLVDCETGQVQVERLVAVHDAGRMINPGGVYGQIEGGLAQGIGYALTEELVVSEGRTLNPSLENYVIPMALDIPALEMDVLEFPEPVGGPLGAKGIAESPIIPTAPAIRNAILDAVGQPLYELPMTAERVLAALDRAAPGAEDG
ncbi:MAG: molybdopterin-dependent oxidoreductase [Xanthomonadales bacterium]|nr:molybdopterin-dependent oxidoreductase [Xanthomonadales bacterium]NIN59786.1 molybdopterin-dependent oxidoreductase [Xanthomonadales bacterium]NIN75161.1 molybdopterin-dependent oxidoreductase [Xanthomonadales bacterium]NIO12747.1 molybdopterin-dependent oxidoreductase [Xanthomonadales bacterium]NIP12179.1 molybdopterin-dependent oxidoreductase [Xanthomonadales bacterium]